MRDGTRTSIERAFEVAQSGAVANIAELRRALHLEGYDAGQLQGKTLLSQLQKHIRASRPAAPTLDEDGTAEDP